MASGIAVQDDRREEEMRNLFDLTKPADSGRSGVDAVLEINGRKILFELKSTTTGSVTTVRDFGMDHIEKWKGKHWLIGVYDQKGMNLLYSLYGSPRQMEPWIRSKEEYIRPDFELANTIPSKVDINDLYKIVGKKKIYTIQDATKLHKKQYSIEQYRACMDLNNGYSPQRMIKILSDRCKYLIQRGSTLNNPHIPESYFKDWERITINHKKRLRELIIQESRNAESTDRAIQ